MSSDAIRRAMLLLDSGRSAEAIVELDRTLAENPEDAHAHAIQALGYADLGRFEEALASSRRAMGAAPEWAYAHFVNASVLLNMGKGRKALEVALEAVALDPEDESNHGMLASCYVILARWAEARAAAERGLELAPEDERLVNLRALALRQLGEVDEAESALRNSLASDPENAWTFQNLGYAALSDGRADEAVRHFRESLRLDPEDEGSRSGLAEALKARVPLYRPVIAWQMLCSRLSSAMGAGLIIGFFVLVQVLTRAFPDGHPVADVIMVLYASLVWMSWAANALFDVLLLLRGDLRRILTGREKVASVGVLSCLLLAAATLVIKFVWTYPGLQWLAMAFAFAAIPTAGWANLPNGKARLTGVALALVAQVSAILALAAALQVLHRFGWSTSWGQIEVEPAELAAVQEIVTRGTTATNISLLVSVASTWILLGLGFVPEGRGGRGSRRRPR